MISPAIPTTSGRALVDFYNRVTKQRLVVTGAADVDVRELSDQHRQ